MLIFLQSSSSIAKMIGVEIRRLQAPAGPDQGLQG